MRHGDSLNGCLNPGVQSPSLEAKFAAGYAADTYRSCVPWLLHANPLTFQFKLFLFMNQSGRSAGFNKGYISDQIYVAE
jgi:hypothetical protein